jgi:hypothetical protein
MNILASSPASIVLQCWGGGGGGMRRACQHTIAPILTETRLPLPTLLLKTQPSDTQVGMHTLALYQPLHQPLTMNSWWALPGW